MNKLETHRAAMIAHVEALAAINKAIKATEAAEWGIPANLHAALGYHAAWAKSHREAAQEWAKWETKQEAAR